MTLEQLYEARIDSPRSINYYGEFDCFCETVFFSLCDGDTGEALKSYEVTFDEETGEVDFDMEFTSNYDSGYCDFRRLPKCVREHVLAIVEAYMKEQAEENALFEESEELAEMEVAEEVEEKTEMDTPTKVNTLTLAQQYNALLREESNASLRYDNAKANQLEAKRLAFEEKCCIAVGDACIAGWESLTLVFVDGSIYVNSAHSPYLRGYDTYSY